jgi:hypothetical protein
MRDLAQGPGHDPRPGHFAPDRGLRQNAAERIGDQGRAQGNGDQAPRAAAARGTPFDQLGLGDPKKTDAELIAAMAAHPILIERPVVRSRKGTRLCRPPERVTEIL